MKPLFVSSTRISALLLLALATTQGLAQTPTPAANAASATAAQSAALSVEELRKAAWTAYKAKDWQKSIELWNAVLAQKPDDNQALRFRGSTYAETGEHDKALADQTRATVLEPGNSNAWNGLCWGRILANRPLAALPACEKAVALDPGSMASTVNLGHTYLLQGDRANAWAWYEKTIPLLDSEASLKSGPLDDFAIFLQRGWQPDLAKEGKAWFEVKGGARLARKAAADQLLQESKAAEDAKDLDLAITLRAKRIPLLEVLYGATHARVIDAVDALGDLYVKAGRTAAALPLYQRVLAYREKQPETEAAKLAVTLNDVARTLENLARYAEAEPLFVRALAISEKAEGPEHPSTGTSLNNLAELYRSMGQYQRAEPLYVRALAISEKAQGPEHPSTGIRLNNLALLYESMGQYQRAEPLFVRALAIGEKHLGPEHPETGVWINNLAGLYESMGQYQRAEPLYVRALAISEKAEGPEHPSTGTSMNNLALLYRAMGQYQRAEPLYVRALAISEKANGPEHPDTGTHLNNLAVLYKSMGQYQRAEPLYVRALAISEKAEGPEHPSTGIRLNNLAGLYDSMGQYQRAEPLALRAYRIALNAHSPDLLRQTQTTLSTLFKAQDKPDAAIFFGKQAVNTLQSLRGNVAALGAETLKSFDATIESTYRDLSRLLIAQTRLVEAERVLELLKEQEQFQFVRRDASVSALAGKAPLTSFESAQDNTLSAAGAPMAKLYAELSALEDNKGRSPAENTRLKALRGELDLASAAFQKVLDQVLIALSSTRSDKANDIQEAQGLQNTLRELSDKSGENVVALYTVVDKEGYSLILTTPDYRRAYSVPIKADDLNTQIAAYRNTLKNPKLDPTAQARALLDVVLPPAARAELAQAKARTLMWHLDGALRLLPLAALHDGEQYLMQRYRLATFTPA
ncbi:tetratricopeptide repeat protein, partial [Rhodoferax antarcticus]|uniref:tetratricopeptide repeat protein n=1 Tax=Rhodoferax antarcticus TaxID=81479 RepID=UPI0022242577